MNSGGTYAFAVNGRVEASGRLCVHISEKGPVDSEELLVATGVRRLVVVQGPVKGNEFLLPEAPVGRRVYFYR